MALDSALLYYLAYGSNLHPVRLIERVPSASLVGNIPLKNYRLQFNKRSHDGSSKCNLQETGDNADLIHMALYTIHGNHKHLLDRFEGLGTGYREQQINVESNGSSYQCFTYIARDSHRVEGLQPYHWYKKLVLLGAVFHRFPSSYIAQIESIHSIEDSDRHRRQLMDTLLETMMDYDRTPIDLQ